MPGWAFSKSTEATANRLAEKEDFDITCCCGQHIAGARQPQPQVALCAMCQEEFLILPANPYPPLQAAGTARRKKKSKSAASKYPLMATVGVAWKVIKPAITWPVVLSKTVAQVSVYAATKTYKRLLAAARFVRAQFTLLRIVIVSMLALVGGTVYWQLQRADVEAAKVQASASYERGLAALKQNDALTALQEFEQSRAAMDLLKRDDLLARKVRQYARELRVATSLSTDSYFDILDEAIDVRLKRGDSAWQEYFARQYKDDWLILELKGTGIPTPQTDEHQSMMFPGFHKGQPVAIEIPAQIVRHIPESQDDLSLVMAVQWKECQFEETPRPRWIVRFADETAFFWVNYETYQSTGYSTGEFPADDELRHIFDRQAAFMGIDENQPEGQLSSATPDNNDVEKN
ncbi:MAG: hypothetical protein ACKVT0_16870 [Planctomycetaceae bacterium]